jgi:surface polysaccharide O-acyltransferase-like enzyme
MHLKLDKIIGKSLHGIAIQIYVILIVYLILQLLKAPQIYGSKLVDKLRYIQTFFNTAAVEFCSLAPSGRPTPEYVKFCCKIQHCGSYRSLLCFI